MHEVKDGSRKAGATGGSPPSLSIAEITLVREDKTSAALSTRQGPSALLPFLLPSLTSCIALSRLQIFVATGESGEVPVGLAYKGPRAAAWGGPARVTNRSLVFSVHDGGLLCDFERVGGPERAPALASKMLIQQASYRLPMRGKEGCKGKLRSWFPLEQLTSAIPYVK